MISSFVPARTDLAVGTVSQGIKVNQPLGQVPVQQSEGASATWQLALPGRIA